MFKGVQKRLTLLYTATTGAILVVLVGCIFMWNISTKEQTEEEAFQNLWIALSSRVQMDPVLSDAYLAQTEATSRAVIHITENGTPLLFRGAFSPETPRSRLIELAARETAGQGVYADRAPISSSVSQTSVFSLRGDAGDRYHGRMAVTATDKGSKSLLLLTYVTPRTELIWQSLPLFLAACAAGILCILLVSWFFTGWSLKPARDGAKKQAEFIAAASHELRSPLAVIRSCAAALEGMTGGETSGGNGMAAGGGDAAAGGSGAAAGGSDVAAGGSDMAADGSDTAAGGSGAADAQKLLAGIDRECSRMARLVSDMLLLASSDAKNWSLQKSAIETDTLLIETYETFLPICREQELTLKLELPEEPLPRLFADRQRLEQVLSILLDNAVSYTPPGRSVTLKGYTEGKKKSPAGGGGHLVIEVLDRGPGIPDGMKKHVFDRFYRADSARNDKSHFGLGLSIAKELIQIHGGSICVEDREGGGSRFTVRLPIA